VTDLPGDRSAGRDHWRDSFSVRREPWSAQMNHVRWIARAARLTLATASTLMLAVGAATAADHVVFVTDYGLYGRHTYYFVAMEKGYYAAENLDVEIVRSQGSANTIKQVANGTAQLGFADAFAVVLGRANDDIPVKLVAMIYPKPPHAVYVLKSSGITTPKDFADKTLADTAFSSVPKLFTTYAKAAGFDPSTTKWIAANSDALPALLTTKRVDGIGQFTVGEPLLAAAAAPQEVVGFPYADAGLDYYSNGIVAADEMIKNDPDLIRRFVKATLHGLATAIADPQEAGQIMHKYHPEIDTGIAIGETKKVRELAMQPKLGAIEPNRVDKTIAVVAATYPLKKNVISTDVYAPGFLPN
jgi:NitT/TauT family transport system substrate-binding protein